MACKGICERHKAVRNGTTGIRYAEGQKRYNYCSIFMVWDGRHCPCCVYVLRTKPRFRKYKERLRAQITLQNTQKKI
jgi:hypothetical protein